MNLKSEQRIWTRYLEAEAAGRVDDAEAALALLFQGLPRPAPQAGFAHRVMARIGRRSAFALPVVRFGLAASLVAAAFGVVLLLPMLPGLLGLVEPGALFGTLARTISSATARLASGASFWQGLGAASRALGHAVLQPRILTLLVVQFAVAAAALRALATMATPRRSNSHATL